VRLKQENGRLADFRWLANEADVQHGITGNRRILSVKNSAEIFEIIPARRGIAGAPPQRGGKLFDRDQPTPRALERQLDSHGGGEKNVDFARLDFLQISGGNFGSFRQLFLGQAFSHSFPADIRAKRGNSCPFFFAQRHDILHRREPNSLNDTLYREINRDSYCQSPVWSYSPRKKFARQILVFKSSAWPKTAMKMQCWPENTVQIAKTRREILRKIFARFKKQRAERILLKASASWRRIK
jgi:hypothetical protein